MSKTIYDVAEHSGVSISTVSRVLNAPQSVNPDTRQRVLQAIDALDFVPRAEASARARKATRRIGVLAPFFAYLPSFSQRLRGITTALSDSSYELVVYNTNSEANTRTQLENLPVARRIDGLIIMSIVIDDEEVKRLVRNQLPTVTIELTHPQLSGIEIDNVAGGTLAAQYLLDRGYREIGFIGDNKEFIRKYTVQTNVARLEGFRRQLAEAGVEMPPEWIQFGSYRLEDGYSMSQRLLDLPKPPRAIFAGSDMLALGALKAARERGIAVPDQLAVIGFDNLDISDYLGLTTITQSLDESGRVAVELLLSRLTDENRSTQHVRLPMRVIERQTA
ncbi:MAG: LacI family DNA-binding transcriptional regulator [Caldilineaceae bacterium]